MRPLVFLNALLLAACATSVPPQLVEARRAYRSLGIEADPNDADAARRALVAANRELDERGNTVYARDLAYVAARRTDIAAANARAEQHRRRAAWLNTEAVTLRTQAKQRAAPQVAAAPAEPPAETSEAVTSPDEWSVPPAWPEPAAAEVEAPAEPVAPAPPPAQAAARAPPPSRPKQARATAPASEPSAEPELAGQLSTFSTKKDEPRGTVITVAAALIFAPGKTDLAELSHDRLEQLAKFLSSDKRDITVEVYTDNLGSASENLKLSTGRAKAVRDALISYGVPESRIQARGLGSVKPVAENSKPEGRAQNRRLEIVLHGYAKPVS